MTFDIIEKSCNRSLVGKVYWKNVCLPSVLYGFKITKIKNEYVNKLQVIENNVYRKILRAPSYTPVATLRAEIGSSLMKSRIMKDKLKYFRSIFDRNNDILKIIANDERSILSKETNLCLQEIQLTKQDLLNNSKDLIDKKVREWDNKNWADEIEKKTSLILYRQFKDQIKEEKYYNDEKSLIRFRFKTNTLLLNDRKRHQNENTKCSLCGYNLEDLSHFLLECSCIEEERQKITYLQRPRIENVSLLMGKLIFEMYMDYENELYSMWKRRKLLLENLQEVN